MQNHCASRNRQHTSRAQRSETGPQVRDEPGHRVRSRLLPDRDLEYACRRGFDVLFIDTAKMLTMTGDSFDGRRAKELGEQFLEKS